MPANANDLDEARSITGTRVFDAPRELVFDAFTDSKHIGNWWGPRGFRTTTKRMDARPGGEWIFTMHGPDGTDYPNEVVYLDVVRPERIAYTHGPVPVFDVEITFEELSPKKTRLTMRMTFATAEFRNQVAEEFGAIEGMQQTLERLEEQVAQQSGFVIRRAYDVPRDFMFRMWTEPKHLAQWWGPKGCVIEDCSNDLQPGGLMHWSMRIPSGELWWGRWLYREVVEPERLVFVSSFSNAERGVTRHPLGPEWPLQLLATITFDERDGGTLVTVHWAPYDASEAERAVFDANHDSMNGGWTGTFDSLSEYLAKIG